ncbi:MAG TPA: hypothetical protein PJ988_09955 [Anaerolinea sp.]|nr:hypothetical protein [Anaerolinea sp.]
MIILLTGQITAEGPVDLGLVMVDALPGGRLDAPAGFSIVPWRASGAAVFSWLQAQIEAGRMTRISSFEIYNRFGGCFLLARRSIIIP